MTQTKSHLKLEKPKNGLQNPGVGVTSGPQRDHVVGVVIIIEEEMNACGWEPRHTGSLRL